MLVQELYDLVQQVLKNRHEGQYLEIKKAEKGTPERLYDTLSSFSNQNGGGIILFGIDEANGFTLNGVYDPQDIQKKVAEQCEQMQPKVRPLFTVCELDGKYVVSAEISECDLFERPCYYIGKGRMRGSYVRVGEADKPMTEYEVYSYEVYKRKIQDELRVDPRADIHDLNQDALTLYFAQVKENKKQLSTLEKEQILSFQGITQDGKPTIVGELLFGIYPQSLFPQYSIIASIVPGTAIGELGEMGERFLDDTRIEGTVKQMLDDAVAFVSRNMKRKVILNAEGKRSDIAQYPIIAVREALLNALIHRDYSIHTENAPIRLLLFNDRLEIENPGGLYGRGTIEKLGEVGFDTRNPYLAGALELLIGSENRYSGILTMRIAMKEHGLKPPVFYSGQGIFRVTLHNDSTDQPLDNTDYKEQILSYCAKPRSREELARQFHFSTPSYFLNQYVRPLVQEKKLIMTVPDKPKSKNQRYVRAE